MWSGFEIALLAFLSLAADKIIFAVVENCVSSVESVVCVLVSVKKSVFGMKRVFSRSWLE
jgi:hypothetical protein